MASRSEGEVFTMPKGAEAPQGGARMLFRDADGEHAKPLGLWVSADIDPRQRNVQLNLSIAEAVKQLDPATMHGLDRLRFLSGIREDEGNLVIEQDSVPVNVLIDPDGQPFVLLGGDERIRLPVTLAHWSDGEDAGAAKQRLLKLLRERQKQERRLRERAMVRDQQGLMTLPSEAGQVLGMPLTKSGTKASREAKARDLIRVEEQRTPADIRGATRLVGAMVTVELDPDTRASIAERKKRKKKKGATLSMALPFDQVRGEEADLVSLAWSVLQWLDTDALLTLLAVMHHAIRGDGDCPAAASVIGHLRGLIGADGRLDKARRKELDQQLAMLLRVKLKVTPYGGEHQDTLPLLVEVGTRTIRGRGEVPLLAVNPRLTHRMLKGRALLMDRRVLGFNAARQEWALRLYFFLSNKWNLGWVGQHLHARNGAIEVKLSDLLTQCGLVEWRGQVKTRGHQAVLLRVKSALRELEEATGGPLLHAELVAGDRVQDSVVRARPSDTLAGELTQARSRTIGWASQVESKPTKPKPKRRRSPAGA
jgi:hypothetical protein